MLRGISPCEARGLQMTPMPLLPMPSVSTTAGTKNSESFLQLQVAPQLLELALQAALGQ